MIFYNINPQKCLEEFVSCFRLRHFIIPNHLKPSPKPFSPHPEQCITFYPRGIELTEFIGSKQTLKRPRSIISGQFTNRINRSSLLNEIIIIVVVFKPGALYRLTGIPFNLLQDQDIDLEDVFPKEAKIVNELLSSSNDYNEMILIIQKFLLEIVGKIKIEYRSSDKIFSMMSLDNQKHSLDWLANQACLSHRQLQRKCNQYIGVGPDLFARIVRFHKSYQMRLMYPELDWLSIALHCDYYDYQHLAKDYKDFVNTTPNLFYNDDSKSLEKVLGLHK
jgi:AraC-like DNA-binding protein